MVRTNRAARRADDARLARLVRDVERRRRLAEADARPERSSSARTRSARSATCCSTSPRTRRCSSGSPATRTPRAAPNENYGARADGAVHARRRPRRLHARRRPRAGARADRLAQRLASGDGPTTSATTRARTTTARRRSSARPATSTGRTRAGSASTHPLHPSFFVAKLWSYFVPTRADARDAERRSSGSTSTQLPGPARRRGDPAAPGALHRAADGEAAGRLHRRAAARARPRRSTPPQWCLARRSSAASGSSTRRTSPAGTTSRWLDTATFRGRWFIAALALSRRARAAARQRRATRRSCVDRARRVLGQRRRSAGDDAHGLLAFAREPRRRRSRRTVEPYRAARRERRAPARRHLPRPARRA